MKFIKLLPSWAQPIFLEAGLELNFEERKMNCASCSVYSQSVKCCTFFPNLANFAAGFELQKNEKIFDTLLESKTLSLPLGIHAPDSYKAAYLEKPFGQSKELLCPHFNRTARNCSIWESRPSSCVRFVCKSSLESLGQEIWESTETALRALEANLAYEAALQLGLVNYEINTDRWTASSAEKVKFYLAAAVYVKSLSISQKVELAGEEFASACSQILALRAAL